MYSIWKQQVSSIKKLKYSLNAALLETEVKTSRIKEDHVNIVNKI